MHTPACNMTVTRKAAWRSVTPQARPATASTRSSHVIGRDRGRGRDRTDVPAAAMAGLAPDTGTRLPARHGFAREFLSGRHRTAGRVHDPDLSGRPWSSHKRNRIRAVMVVLDASPICTTLFLRPNLTNNPRPDA